ncbi:unnamed protein product [Cylindrotheca closterium]|uniref:Uncharacterized protein n=1 Tax=Cylindrotheca closterium TaxID=2856 RepID=A0AAD2PY91_9STRA|nr:unnamed protein product [Cylindrotheca closterium]
MTDQAAIATAKDLMHQWGETVKSSSVIYTFGFVSFLRLSEDYSSGGRRSYDYVSMILLFVLMLVALVIQTVIPIAIALVIQEEIPSVCPNRADPLTKFIGFFLCMYFVVLTSSMCTGKVRALAFLRLFCSRQGDLGSAPLFLDLGILVNVVSMGAAGTAQYLLFIRNAQDRDYVTLLLQSLSMQFVLTADEKLLTRSWGASTKQGVEALMKRRNREMKKDEEGEGVMAEEEVVMDETILKRARFMGLAESTFRVVVSIVGLVWSALLTYCM